VRFTFEEMDDKSAAPIAQSVGGSAGFPTWLLSDWILRLCRRGG
jgi:hypothetical protein